MVIECKCGEEMKCKNFEESEFFEIEFYCCENCGQEMSVCWKLEGGKLKWKQKK